jgi:hypothetical protein
MPTVEYSDGGNAIVLGLLYEPLGCVVGCYLPECGVAIDAKSARGVVNENGASFGVNFPFSDVTEILTYSDQAVGWDS